MTTACLHELKALAAADDHAKQRRLQCGGGAAAVAGAAASLAEIGWRVEEAKAPAEGDFEVEVAHARRHVVGPLGRLSFYFEPFQVIAIVRPL